MVIKCPNCNAPAVDDKALFCNKCGSKIPEDPTNTLPICNNCGSPAVDEQAKFCNKCGNPLNKIKIEKKLPIEKSQRPLEKVPVVERQKNYSHIPLIAEDGKGVRKSQDEKISLYKNETFSITKGHTTKKIQETRCTCLACGKVWYYGKSEVFQNYSAKLRNTGKNLSGCTCCWPMSYMSRENTDLDKCPNCGSKAVNKEQIIHDVE